MDYGLFLPFYPNVEREGAEMTDRQAYSSFTHKRPANWYGRPLHLAIFQEVTQGAQTVPNFALKHHVHDGFQELR